MAEKIIDFYGSWKSPVSSEIAARQLDFLELAADDSAVYWIESRPQEEGRYVLLMKSRESEPIELTPPPFSAKSSVHEYGGGAFVITGSSVIFSNAVDQRLYSVAPGQYPRPVTTATNSRYSDGCFDRSRNRVICVREIHNSPHDIRNELTEISLTGESEPKTLIAGNDFYAAPRLSPDGRKLAWLTWNHPKMPWMETELWTATVDETGSLRNHVKVAGGDDESIAQPEWSPDGVLHFVSDKDGWWNIYRMGSAAAQNITTRPAEFAQPQWEFGLCNYAFLGTQYIICSYIAKAVSQLACLDLGTGAISDLDFRYCDITHVRSGGDVVYLLAASHTEPRSVLSLNPSLDGTASMIRRSFNPVLLSANFSIPTAVAAPVSGERVAHSLYYPPRNAKYEAPHLERPPLLLWCHGGPAFMSSPGLDLAVQYWTTRGFAVAALNYVGSSGYGRRFREQLHHQWGVADVQDAIATIEYLASNGYTDPQRVAISGRSAGGYLAMRVLSTSAVAQAGASYFGVFDLEELVKKTHKFESHYVEWLVAQYPEFADVYRERSPINDLDKPVAPVILFQGEEDDIVPKEHLYNLLNTLRLSDTQFLCITFAGEKHGFRKGSTLQRALDAELWFYSMFLLRSLIRE